MKKVLAIALAVSLIVVQLITVFPVLAQNPDGSGELIGKFTEYNGYSANQGYTNNSVTVDDNENFNTALEFEVTNSTTFGTGKEVHFYRTTTLSIADWASNPDAEMRLWIKTAADFSTRLSIMCQNGAYPHIYKNITVEASDKWQEIRLKRSDFTTNATFDSAVAGTFNYCVVRFVKETSTIEQNKTIQVSQPEFYDGAIAETVDPNGGTIGSQEGSLISEFKSYDDWYDTSRGYVRTRDTVEDNENFTEAFTLKVTDLDVFNSKCPQDIYFYRTNNQSIGDWANNPDAEMRLWIRTAQAFTTNLSIMCYNGSYPHITKEITVEASDKWQEIRLKRSDFSTSADFDTATAGTFNYCTIRFQVTADFIGENKAIEVGPAEFYDGYIAEELDADGGTITSGEGSLISEFKSYDDWYDTSRGYVRARAEVKDNENFTEAFTFKVTDLDVFNSKCPQDIYFYRTNNQSIGDWAKNPDAEMRLWIRTAQAFTTKLSVMCSNGAYPHATKEITVEASDKWQEIRLKRSDFTADESFNTATAGTFNYCTVRFQVAADFIGENKTIEVGPAEFYDGYIAEELDTDGGTISTTPVEGTKITEFNSNCWYSTEYGYTKTEQTVIDNTNFSSALAFKVTDSNVFDNSTKRDVSFYENTTDSIADWAKKPYAEMRFWIKSSVDFTTKLSVMCAKDSSYNNIETSFTVIASDKWQEIRFKRSDFAGSDTAFNTAVEGGFAYTLVRFITDPAFIAQGDVIEISPIEFYNGYIAEAIDPNGGTIVVQAQEGDKITEFNSNCWYSTEYGYTKTEQTVIDNTNFSSALTFKVTDSNVFDNSTKRDVSFYENTTDSIADWAKTPYAEMRFWIRSKVDFTTKLSVMCAKDGSYNNIETSFTVIASDKWQEIRFKRSDFVGSDTAFNTAVEGGFAYTLVRFITDPAFIAQGDVIEISPIEFYDGYIAEAIDPNGGTIVIVEEEGEKIAEFDSNCWYSTKDGYTKTEQTVVDNKNFDSALAFKITDSKVFDSVANRNISFYENKSESIAKWAQTPYAEMRFWIRSEVDFTTTLSVMCSKNKAYPHITTELSVKASDKWQEIRIKRSDFAGETAFNTAVESGFDYTLVRFMTTAGFIPQGKKIEISPIEFYDGYIAEAVDSNGGTIVIVEEEGEKIAEFDSECWNSGTKGFKITGEIVDDNSNFKNALKFELTDKALFNASDRNLYFYETKTDSIAQWAKTPYAEMRFWIKSKVDFKTTLSILCYTGSSYPHITVPLEIKGSDKWQEIRIKRSDFAGEAAFNTAVAGTFKYCAMRFMADVDFVAVGDTIEVSPIEFYDGYIAGAVDSNGGTVEVPEIYGELKATLPAKVINSFKGLQTKTVSVTDNEFVSNALKLTATDTAALYEKKQHVYTNGVETPVNLSDWYNYSKAELRLWVKVPHSMKLTFLIVESTGKAYPYISATVEIPAADGWQEIRIPRSAFSSNSEFTGEFVKFFRILTPEGEGNKAEFLDFCESMYISQVEFYNGIIPASANKADRGTAGKLITKVDLKPADVNGSIIEKVEVKNNSNFKKAVAVHIENARIFADGETSHYLHLHEELMDISKWYNNPNAEIRFWVKTDKDIVLKFGFQNPYSETKSSYRAIWAQMSLSGSDKWQEVRLIKKNFSENVDFDPTVVGRIKIIGEGDYTITTNEIFYVSDVEIYDGYISKAVDANGGTTSVSKENGIIATFSSFDAKAESSGYTLSSAEVDTNKYFTQSVKLSGGSNAKFKATLKTFYDLADISRGKNGTVRLWVRSSDKQTFNIVLTDKNGKAITLTFDAKASDKWQELRVNLSDVNTSGFDFTKLFAVSATGTLKSGVTLEIGKIEMWKSKLTTKPESDGGTLEPLPELPPDWNSLEKYKGESEMFAKTATSNFWINDWNDKTRPRSITAYNRGLDNKDENYYRFTMYKEISVVDPSVYYKNPTPAGFGFNEAVDMTPYLKTGTMRFWINVPKNMSVKITLKSQFEGKYTDSSVTVYLKKTTESNGFQEVKIPLKDFYDAAIKAGTKWNPYYIKHILIGGVDGCTAGTFLAKDEILNVTQFEFWKGEALEPPPYDPTRIFYSMQGKVFVKDINEVLAKTAMFSAYKETLMLEEYGKIVKKYFGDAKLQELYQIELISADAYNYKRVGAYDKVSVYIPIGDINTDNLAVAIYNSSGLYTCDFTIEDGYIVIETKEFGMFLFMKGGKRNSVEFDYEDDLRNQLMLLEGGLDSDSSNGISSWLSTTSGVVVLIVICAVAVLAAAGVVVFVILKKKGVILRKK